jgi:hypothetical protein
MPVEKKEVLSSFSNKWHEAFGLSYASSAAADEMTLESGGFLDNMRGTRYKEIL